MPGFHAIGEAPIGALAGSGSVTLSLADSLTLGLAATSLHTALLRAKLALEAEPSSSLDGVSALRDALVLEDGLALVFRELLAANLAFGAGIALDYTAIARMVDALLLAEVVGTAAEAHAVIQEALTLGAVAGATPVSTLVAGLDLSAVVADHYTAIARLIDALALQAAQTPTATLAITLRDDLAMGAEQATSLDAIAVLRDRLDFVLQVAIDDEQYVAWTMHTTSRGATRYTNFPFNSFMRLGGRYYGVTDTGRYLLEGDDDAGEPIAARLRLGMSAMGSRILKRMAAAYLAYSANGDLRLKVITADPVTGARSAHVYRLYAQGAASMREGRVKIGKGLQSVFWDFAIENVDGADFELDVVEILPLVLERRTRGNAGGKP